jgi:hypothetical protein
MLPLLFSMLALHAQAKPAAGADKIHGPQLQQGLPFMLQVEQVFADAAARFGVHGVAHPERLLAALAEHDLAASLADVAALDSGERAELWAALASAGVSIGDRSRLRRLANSGSETENQDSDIKLGHAPYRYTGDDQTITTLQRPRQLQDGVGGAGLSEDSLALVATAVLGMASFLVQARLSAKEQKERTALDRAQALRVNEEASAAKLLERVQGQMAEFVYPMQQLTSVFTKAHERAAFECGCAGTISHRP